MAEETTATTGAAQNAPAGEKTFTQADVDRIVSERLSRAKQPTADEAEMAEFRAWKANQPTQEQKNAKQAADLAAAQKEIAQLRAQGKIMAAQCQPEFADFVTAQLLAMDGKLDENLEAYKKEHPQYFTPTVMTRKSSGLGLSGGGTERTASDIVNGLFRNRE